MRFLCIVILTQNQAIWDVDTRKLLYKLPGHRGTVNDVRFSPVEPISKSFCFLPAEIFREKELNLTVLQSSLHLQIKIFSWGRLQNRASRRKGSCSTNSISTHSRVNIIFCYANFI